MYPNPARRLYSGLRVFIALSLMSFPVFAEDTSTQSESQGLPIFRFNDDHWFELTIPSQNRPENAIEIQDQINRERQAENALEEGKSQFFPDNLDFLNDIQLRYQIRFK